ncbi:MAG: hypothetical protein ACOH5I_08345 [Oligoflexus sp.]
MKHYHVLMISAGLLLGACNEKDDKKPEPVAPSENFLTDAPGSWLYPERDSIALTAEGLVENALRFEPNDAFDGTISYVIDAEQSTCDDSHFDKRSLSPDGRLFLDFKDDFTGECQLTFVAQLMQGVQLSGESRKTVTFSRAGMGTLSFVNLPTTIEVMFDEGLNFKVEASDGSDDPSSVGIRYAIEDNQCAAYFAEDMPIKIDELTGELSGKPSQASPAEGCQLTVVATQGEEGRSISRAVGQLTIIIPAFDLSLSWLNSAEETLSVQALQAIEHEVKAIVADSQGAVEAAINYSLFDNKCEQGWQEALSIDSNTGVLAGVPANDGPDTCAVGVRASWEDKTIEKSFQVTVDKITNLAIVNTENPDETLTSLSLRLNSTVRFKVLGNYASESEAFPFGADLSSVELIEGQDKVEVTSESSAYQVKGLQTGKALLLIKAGTLESQLELVIQDKFVQEIFFTLENGEKLSQVDLRPGENYSGKLQLWYRYTNLQDEEKSEQLANFTLSSDDEAIVTVENNTNLLAEAPGRSVVRGSLVDEQFVSSPSAELAVFVYCQDFEAFNASTQTCEAKDIPEPAGDLYVSGPMLEKKRFSSLQGFQACADIFQIERDWSYRRVIGCQVEGGETLVEVHAGQTTDRSTLLLDRQSTTCQAAGESGILVAKENQIRGDMLNKDIRLVSDAGEKPFLYGSRDYHTYNASCEDLLRHPDRSSSPLIRTLCEQALLDATGGNDSEDTKVKKGCFLLEGDTVRFQAMQ